MSAASPLWRALIHALARDPFAMAMSGSWTYHAAKRWGARRREPDPRQRDVEPSAKPRSSVEPHEV